MALDFQIVAGWVGGLKEVVDLMILPFQEYAFMRRALIGCCFLIMGSAPLGVFVVLRRMSLMGEAVSHGILPGVAFAFWIWGPSLWGMVGGGLIVGLIIAVASTLTARYTPLKEDACFSAYYLISLAAGLAMLSLGGNHIDVMQILLGTLLGISDASLSLLAGVSTLTLVVLALIYRSLVLASVDPLFFRSVGGYGTLIQGILTVLTVLNLICAFHALGTLMALGLMLLPAISAQLWCRTLVGFFVWSWLSSLAACVAGLLISFYTELPASPAILLFCGILYLSGVVKTCWRSV